MALDFPNTPVDGQVYDNYYWDNEMSAWRAFGNIVPLVPAGVISQYAGSTAPDGYLLCTGQSLSTNTYPALFAAIGYTYGGSDSSFNVPNLQNRVPVGLGSETEFDALGETGGSKTHQLTINEMPSHTHIQDAHNHTQDSHNHTQNAHGHAFYGAQTGQNLPFTNTGNVWTHFINNYQYSQPAVGSATATNNAATATNQAATATNQNTGGGLAHNNLQPYIVLNYIIKT
jgi:microcystin-dependent protein